MTSWLFSLAIFASGLLYLGLVAMVQRIRGVGLTRAYGLVTLCWLLGITAICWCWFIYVEAQAAAGGYANIGIGLIFGIGWIIVVVIVPIVATVMLALAVLLHSVVRKWRK